MEISPELLKRYYQGLCSKEEQKTVENWLNTPSSNFNLPPQISFKERKSIKSRVWSKLGVKSNFFNTTYTNPIFHIAATLLIVVGFWWYFKGEQFQPNPTNPVPRRTIKTQRAQKIRLTLPDSTRIVLNDESEISFPLTFSDTIRKVFLRGQAYFEVTKNPHQPFIVETSETRVRVLGTSFDLRAYTSETANKLCVTEGRVRFSDLNNTKSTFVTAGQQTHFEKGNLSIPINSAISGAPAWSRNSIELNDESLQHIAEILERWYDVHITINNKKLRDQRFSGTFNGTSLPVVLNSMSYAIGFNYKIKGKSITIF